MQPSPAEHKLITILFADIVGSTELTDRLGTETARIVLDRCLQRMSASVDKYGGTVAQFMGDGLLAFFGAPLAHEDDPERAGLAALKMHEAVRQYGAELGEDLRLRVGVNTGRAVMGGESKTETTATGKPVVLAKRLESSAKPDETLLGETTARLTRHRFELEVADLIFAKGFDEPIPATRLLGELAQPAPARGIADLHSPLVGRAREHEQLNEILHDLQGGRGCIVTIVGEPGIGKSRLLLEARESHTELPRRWVEGRAYSYTEDQPFSVILDLLAELLEIAPDDPPAMLDLKLETAIGPLLGEQTEEVWPYLASLLGAPIPPHYADAIERMDPEALSARIVNAVVLLIEATAARQPLVVDFEDLHWADRSSLGLIHALMMATERAPILLIFLFRPDRDKPSWELKIRAETEFAHRYAHLALVPLDESSSKELVGNLLAITDIPEPVGNLIQTRSEGNPFYVEELLRELIERGVLVQRDGTWESSEEIAEVVVPETLEKVVQARLDRLPPAERSTLQAASVIGRRFPFRVLKAIASANGDLRDQLLRLQQADLVRERARIPELEYIFKHHVVQEVTYGTLLREQCSQLHRQVAETLIDLFPERIDELHGTLGRHYAEAGDAEEAAEHYEQAARRAEEIFAYEETAQFLELALEMTSTRELTEKRISRLEVLGDIRTYLGENALAVAAYREALDLLRSSEDQDKWTSVRLLRKIGEAVALTETHEERERLDDVAKESLKQATDQTTGELPHPETARVLLAWFLLEVRHVSGQQDWVAAETNAQAALEMAEQLGDPALLLDALAAMEPIYHRRGEIRQQLQIALRRVELARDAKFHDLRARASALLSAGTAHKNVGNFGEAMPLLEEAYILAQEIQAIALQADALGEQAECWFRQDRWDAVVELDERLLALHSRYGISRAGPICFFLGFSASVNALRGNAERARELREEAYQIMIAAGGGSEDDWIRNQHY